MTPSLGPSYNGRVFAVAHNSDNGEVSGSTLFHYHQDNDIVWAEYAGGGILKGFLLGTVVAPDGRLEFHYQHLNAGKEARRGKCVTKPEVLPDGRLRLHETWQWLDGDGTTGTSILEELRKN